MAPKSLGKFLKDNFRVSTGLHWSWSRVSCLCWSVIALTTVVTGFCSVVCMCFLFKNK